VRGALTTVDVLTERASTGVRAQIEGVWTLVVEGRRLSPNLSSV